MKCTYCEEKFISDQWGDGYCPSCQVTFSYHPDYGQQIKFHRKINGRNCYLNLFPESNITILAVVDTSSGYTKVDETLIKELVVTDPQNVENKIKTLLVFS